MKKVDFKNIQIQNFLSIGDTPLFLSFTPGINIITGVNLDKEESKNGVGKSTIADALFFALFGTTIRELKKEHIVNNINEKNCNVTLTFDVIDSGNKKAYVLTRSINPTKCTLIQDEKDITQSSIVKTTEFIYNLISADPDIFQNTTIMTVNNTLPFMAQKKIDKRKFIEGVFRLGVFSDMLLDARKHYNDIKKDLDIENSKFEEVNKNHTIYLEQKNKQEENRKKRVEELKERKQQNLQKIEKLKSELQEILQSELDTLNENIKLLKKKEISCGEAIQTLIKKSTKHETEIEHNKKRIETINKLSDECFVCKRPIKTDDDKKYVIAELNTLNDINLKNNKIVSTCKTKIDEVMELKKTCQNTIDKLQDKLNKLSIIQTANLGINEKIQQLIDHNKLIATDIANIRNEKGEFNDLVDNTSTRLTELQKTMDDIQKKLKIIETVKFIVSEEGVKSFIIKKMLKLLNSKLQFYLTKLDANCTCTFNEYFEESIKNDAGQECCYFNFSGGERKRIDLAILFTFQDIRRLQSNVMNNISIYDELLDSALDDIGTRKVIEILQERVEKYNEAIYIITHKRENVKYANNIVYLEKKRGFTYLRSMKESD